MNKITGTPFIILCILVLVGAFIERPVQFYFSITHGTTAANHFDTLIVLGTPCKLDGTPSPEERERVAEAVREYQRGVSQHIIVSGGAAHNSLVEADCMKRYAVAQSVPADAIVEEPQAHDTIQNIYYSNQIMQAQGWHSAEVISSRSHLPRAALILHNYKMSWHTHAANWPPEYHFYKILAIYAGEIQHCWQIHQKGFPPNALVPTGS
jgi:uncharacterized SAM-binding protein YcdF (DUF218 family)